MTRYGERKIIYERYSVGVLPLTSTRSREEIDQKEGMHIRRSNGVGSLLTAYYSLRDIPYFHPAVLVLSLSIRLLLTPVYAFYTRNYNLTQIATLILHI